ncbi:hypothetical protein [Rhizobium rhizogenes]|uniref:hypothetical protein n=1 Tax=Rhizobium rhizogenes TaxID=359 RepID=UPI00080FE954|nr:hypothetical protein [Rhizobium rhizogenes]NTI42863.1 hypothetical protein [Rhizobium rhizogenes]OCJ22377.1 hypothetical protein A6U88_29650 [Agrobacterium sp. B131/95]
MLRSFLQPADRLFPMVATQDVGHLAAALLHEDWSRAQVIELEGAAHIAERSRASLRHGAETPNLGRDGAARELGQVFPFSVNAKSIDSDPDARRPQRGMDRLQRARRSAMKGATALESVIAELIRASHTKASV